MKTIAIIPGSYNPFHVGHLNILEKSEAIFGRGNVYLSFGINPDKIDPLKVNEYIIGIEEKIDDLSLRIGRPIKLYKGFLHDFISDLEKDNNVVVVRGLRNGDDLDYEVNQSRFINDFKKDVKTIFIMCDKEYEHISSSAIRKLKEFGGEEMIKKYIV